MGARRRLARIASTFLLILLTFATVLGSPAASGQQPESELERQIAAAEAELDAAQAKLAATYERFSNAERRHEGAAAAARAAQATAARARAEAEAAARREREMRGRFDRFTSASFRQGSTIGSISAYLGSDSPTEMLDRASLLNVLGAEHLNVLDTMRRAVQRKATAERTARESLRRAVANRDEAAKAKQAAERAYAAAEQAQNAAKAETERLADKRAALASQASSGVSGGGQTGTGGVVLPAQGTLTSTYGARWGTIHYGIDIANDIGTPILSTMAGEVISSGPASGFGLWVRVQHDNGLITVYGHINESLVSVGQRVAAGQQIATMGNRGQSTGPHLHFEVHQDGSKIDPLIWLRSHGIDI